MEKMLSVEKCGSRAGEEGSASSLEGGDDEKVDDSLNSGIR